MLNIMYNNAVGEYFLGPDIAKYLLLPVKSGPTVHYFKYI